SSYLFQPHRPGSGDPGACLMVCWGIEEGNGKHSLWKRSRLKLSESSMPSSWLVATQGSHPRCRPKPRIGARLQCSCCQPGPGRSYTRPGIATMTLVSCSKTLATTKQCGSLVKKYIFA